MPDRCLVGRSMIRHAPECASVAAVVPCDCGGWVPRAVCAKAGEVERLQAWLAYLDEASEDDTVRAAVELALKGEAPDPIGGGSDDRG